MLRVSEIDRAVFNIFIEFDEAFFPVCSAVSLETVVVIPEAVME